MVTKKIQTEAKKVTMTRRQTETPKVQTMPKAVRTVSKKSDDTHDRVDALSMNLAITVERLSNLTSIVAALASDVNKLQDTSTTSVSELSASNPGLDEWLNRIAKSMADNKCGTILMSEQTKIITHVTVSQVLQLIHEFIYMEPSDFASIVRNEHRGIFASFINEKHANCLDVAFEISNIYLKNKKYSLVSREDFDTVITNSIPPMDLLSDVFYLLTRDLYMNGKFTSNVSEILDVFHSNIIGLVDNYDLINELRLAMN